MPLALIETVISADSIRMRFADHGDSAKANHWLDFRVAVSELRDVYNSNKALGPLVDRHLVVIQQAALRVARSAIDAQISVLDSQKDQTV